MRLTLQVRSARWVLLSTVLVLLLFPASLRAQSRTVTGTVTDAAGQPVAGAMVVVESTQAGDITTAQGNYSISVPAGSATLTFSYLGMVSQSVEVAANQMVANVVMQSDSQVLDDVVVVGYGTMRKKDLTGSVVQIRPDAIANENPGTVQDILRGTPGLAIGYDPSAKGGGTMSIRGQRSVYKESRDYSGPKHSEPLIVLDGMMFFGELSEINPDDIAQIDVLKDGSAAAIYGARSANGVVIVTTKKGKIGKPVVNLTANVGVVQKSAYREVYSPDGYMRYREDWYKTPTYGVNPSTGVYEAYQNGTRPLGYYDSFNSLPAGVSLEQWRMMSTNTEGESDRSIYAKRLALGAYPLDNYIKDKSFDWYKNTFRLGLRQDYNVSVSGAGENVNYYLSLGYMNNEGAVIGNEYATIRANMKIDAKVTEWFDLSANVNFQDRTDGDIQPSLGGAGYDTDNWIRNSPYATYINDKGEYEIHPMGEVGQGKITKGFNYMFDRQFQDLEKGYQIFNTIITARVKLPFNINYSFNASPRFQYFHDRYFESASHPDWATNPQGRVDRENRTNFDWSLNNTLNWEQTFADKHRLNVTLVQEAEQHTSWRDRIQAREILPSDALGFHNTSNANKEKSTFETTDRRESAAAYMARLFYSFDNKYMITASVRRDGYSAFGQNNPWAVFPSLALGWSFVDENFFKWEPMSTGKLRVSWGETGNRQLEDPYLAYANLGSGNNRTQAYINSSGGLDQFKYLTLDRMANNNLQWERSRNWNVGLDFGFLNDRISGSFEYYNTSTQKMIMEQPLPGFSGFSKIATNLGEVRNSGFEFTIASLNMRRDNFEWRTSFAISYNKNTIKHLFYEYDENGREMDYTTNGWFIGQPIDVIWDYKVEGIWQADEIEEAKKYGQIPGDPKIWNNPANDAKGTITYNNDDKVFLGTRTPPVNWSLRNDFTLFKNLSIGFNIYSFMGGKRTAGYYMNQDNGGNVISAGFNTYVKEYWTPENPTNKYGRLDAQSPRGLTGVRNKVYNSGFIRLGNISVGYTLPRAWTEKIDIQTLKVYANVNQAAVWAFDWEYGDPEVNNPNTQNGSLATRVFTFGVNLTF